MASSTTAPAWFPVSAPTGWHPRPAAEASNHNATVLGTRALQLAGAAGAEVVLGNATSLFRVRIYIFDHSTVEVALGGALAALANASADTFLASLTAR